MGLLCLLSMFYKVEMALSNLILHNPLITPLVSCSLGGLEKKNASCLQNKILGTAYSASLNFFFNVPTRAKIIDVLLIYWCSFCWAFGPPLSFITDLFYMGFTGLCVFWAYNSSWAFWKMCLGFCFLGLLFVFSGFFVSQLGCLSFCLLLYLVIPFRKLVS